MSEYTRRGFIGAAASAAALAAAPHLRAAESSSEQARGDRSRSDVGPKNPEGDAQNPDSFAPPTSDAGAVQTFKYPFSLAHKRLHEGGWSREVTVRELEIAKTLAGVNMRLTAGGIRELHWHSAAEWAFMFYGNARITAIDAEGKAFVSDIGEGDLWYFPPGIPHSIQGLNPDGAEFLLVFDEGTFSEYATVLLSDWMAHTPKDILVKNFEVPMEALAKLPNKELFIFQKPVPGPLEDDQRAAAGQLGLSNVAFDFRTSKMKPNMKTKGGEVRIIDSKNFNVANNIATALVTLQPGGLRELHWHPNADEWLFITKGKARMTVFASGGRARTMDFQSADVGYIQKSLPHYIENIGDTECVFMEMFASSFFQDLSLNEWLTHAPPELVMQHLNIDKATLDAIPKKNFVNLPA